MNAWRRYLAYAQSSSFATYLIDTFGIKKFFAFYDQTYEDQYFKTVFGRSEPALVVDRQGHIRAPRWFRNIEKHTQ